MDAERFDRLARTVAAHASRRQVLRLVAGAAMAGLLPSQAGALQEATGEPACEAGLTFCPEAGACVDLQTNMANCGACGSVCESQLVPVACREGECVRANCPPGSEYCGAVDLCRDLSIDPQHCGACGNACESGICVDGACADAPGESCAAGQTNCGGVCIDTCCDNANCGACGIACPEGMTCFEGQCGCPSGLCGPVKPPNTGSGMTGAERGIGAWAALALSGVTASLAAMMRKPASTDDTAGH